MGKVTESCVCVVKMFLKLQYLCIILIYNDQKHFQLIQKIQNYKATFNIQMLRGTASSLTQEGFSAYVCC